MVLEECRCWLAGRTLIGSWYAGCQRTRRGSLKVMQSGRYLEDSHAGIEKLAASGVCFVLPVRQQGSGVLHSL
jgi:hypothetical protein